MKFDAFFKRATGNFPYPFQTRFAECEQQPELLSVPTGVGKTATAILGWLFRRRFASKSVKEATPRRLVYCLPMRTLVEQTEKSARSWLEELELSQDVGVHLLMGGAESGDWDVHPEREAILIGTQDMLLSRALNRGYGMSRYRWPMQFGLLNNDCLWVMDEVQSMGSGLVTTTQMAAFAKRLWLQSPPCSFLWMSATLGESFLKTRDREDWKVPIGTKLELNLDPDDPKSDINDRRVEKRLRKRLRQHEPIQLIKDCPKPSQVLDAHGEGRLTLVVVNTVPTAMRIYDEIQEEKRKRGKKKAPLPETCLLHSRFRPIDRVKKMDIIQTLLKKSSKDAKAAPDDFGLVLVSTQVIEAGFDISSVRLWSEVAPWVSVVQRLGRLNREGLQPDATAMFWMPKDDKSGENNKDSPNAKRIGPYEKSALEISRKLLNLVIEKMARGTEYRDALDEASQTKEGQESLQVDPDVVIRPDDFYELFSTEPDLAGGSTNISQFVRDADRNVDVHVFWRDIDAKRGPEAGEPAVRRDELCAVPFFDLRRFLGTKEAAWEWNYEVSRWERRRSYDVQPGMTLLLPLAVGGYSNDIGWTGNASDKPTVDVDDGSPNDGLDRDPGSSAEKWVSLADHLADVEAELQEILETLGIENGPLGRALLTAAQWHDWGKSLDRWQTAVNEHVGVVCNKLAELQQDSGAAAFHSIATAWDLSMKVPASKDGLWAKFPDIRKAWQNNALTKDQRSELKRRLRTPFLPRLRHEAASALAAWDAWLAGESTLTALAVYLIASHHGKARTILRSSRGNDEVFGLTAADVLREVPGRFAKEAVLHFEAKFVGAHGEWNETGTEFRCDAPSWIQMMGELLGPVERTATPTTDAILESEPRHLGPFVLAYLEALLRAADARASRNPGKGAKR